MAGLTKSDFVAGCQCPKLLWWRVHDPAAPELQPDKVLLDRFDQGRLVGELARAEFSGGVLIDPRDRDRATRVEATHHAMSAHAPVIFEASFESGGVFVSADILLRTDSGYTLIEAKSTTALKDEHIPDVAVQTWVLRQSGVPVSRVAVIHLNPNYRHPGDGAPLLATTDATAEVEAFLPNVPALVAELSSRLDGPLPDHPIGLHCFEPRECVFQARCWPDDPNHIGTLYNNGPKRTCQYMSEGVHSIWDIPPTRRLPVVARRQLRSLRDNRLIVEPGLASALQPFEGPLGYLDFETVVRAVPVWDGLAPWGAATAQFSYHEEKPNGTHTHVGWLAEGPGDPRRELAERMIAATAGANRIATYSAYEKTRITELQRLIPDLASPLGELLGKLVDLLPVVRDHVYHPGFKGSFSIKAVLNPLVPDLTYSDLVIVDGLLASVEIARLLFVAHKIPPDERDRLRADLLAYCERDTWAMVRLMGRLRELAKGTSR